MVKNGFEQDQQNVFLYRESMIKLSLVSRFFIFTKINDLKLLRNA